jgi:DNA invertase Pin-like site-specific DNA recombinase
MTTTVGYARVSTFEQILDLQQDALTAAGCKKIFTDTASGGRSDRPGLQQALDYLRAGDVLVVWRLDRLGRSLKYLIEIITTLNERGVGFKSLTEQIDTTTSGGKLIFHVFGALAEFERDIIRERTQAGLAAARARGRMGGRPKKLDGAAKIAMAQALYDDQTHSVADICTTLGISRTTLYRYVKVARPGGARADGMMPGDGGR